jgi:hypothetical protein
MIIAGNFQGQLVTREKFMFIVQYPHFTDFASQNDIFRITFIQV